MSDSQPSGTLYIVATPIGNVRDISLRAIDVLSSVSMIACEDTRRSGRLLKELDIDRPLCSYHSHSARSKEHRILEKLKQGEDIALVSDAGTPSVSDPGARLIEECRRQSISVIPVPGASALAAALSVAAVPGRNCLFLGFLSPKSARRKKELARAAGCASSIVCFESPYRIRKLLKDILDILGNVEVCLCREMTKRFEQYISGSAQDVLEDESWPEKGEFTVVLSLPNIKKGQKRPGQKEQKGQKEREKSSKKLD